MTLFFFFFNDTATTEIYTLSLHDALPILRRRGVRRPLREKRGHVRIRGLGRERRRRGIRFGRRPGATGRTSIRSRDRKSTRLNSSHLVISYAVFCLKKKNNAYVAVSTLIT